MSFLGLFFYLCNFLLIFGSKIAVVKIKLAKNCISSFENSSNEICTNEIGIRRGSPVPTYKIYGPYLQMEAIILHFSQLITLQTLDRAKTCLSSYNTCLGTVF